MFKNPDSIYNQYPKSFWALIAAIFFLSATIFYLANFSELSPQIILSDCKQDSETVSESLRDAEETFVMCSEIISRFAGESELDTLVKNMDTVLLEFVNSRELAVGYFYKLESPVPSADYEVYFDSAQRYHISRMTDPAAINDIERRCNESRDTFWVNLHNYMTDVTYLSYVVPLYKSGEYIGFVGMNLDLDYLRMTCFPDDNEYAFNMLVSSEHQVLINPYQKTGTNLAAIDGYYQLHRMMDAGQAEGYAIESIGGKTWVLAYTTLPTKQIYVTSVHRAFRSMVPNYLNFFITFLAIVCISLVQTNKRTGQTIFDYMSELTLKPFTMSAPDLIRKRAALALYLGMTISAFANFVFALPTLGFNHSMIHLAMLSVLVFIFKVFKGQTQSPWILALFIAATVIAPIRIHLMLGGFASGNTGSLLLWTSMSCIVVMFMFNARLGQYVFYLFVVLLFMDVLVEIYLLRNTDYYRIFTFVAALFLLGFASFTCMHLFMVLSEKDYNESVTVLEELRQAQAQLVQREKMVTLGQLIAGIAHEINTPIGAIKASSEVLDSTLESVIKALGVDSRGLSEEDFERLLILIDAAKTSVAQMRTTMEIRRAKTPIREFLTERGNPNAAEITNTLASLEICDLDWIRGNAELFASENIITILKLLKRLSPIINGSHTIGVASDKISKIVFALRSYAHTNVSGDRTLFDVVKTIENVLIIYHHQLKQGIEVLRDYEEVPEVYGNPDELGQVWTNLVQNAIFAMNDSGKLSISVRLESGYVVVRFTDTGTGVPEDIRDKIFEPFYTTKPLGQGSGLGLDICAKIADAHGGKLSLERTDNTGSTFSLRLPVGDS